MFGKRLRMLRKERKLTMKDFGKYFNLAESTISGYEGGSRKPDMDTINKFADYFDVTTDYLLGRSDNPTYTADEEANENRGFDALQEINRLLKEYGIEQSGFFDIESWKAMGPEDIEKLESYFKFITEEAKRREKDK